MQSELIRMFSLCRLMLHYLNAVWSCSGAGLISDGR